MNMVRGADEIAFMGRPRPSPRAHPIDPALLQSKPWRRSIESNGLRNKNRTSGSARHRIRFDQRVASGPAEIFWKIDADGGVRRIPGHPVLLTSEMRYRLLPLTVSRACGSFIRGERASPSGSDPQMEVFAQ